MDKKRVLIVTHEMKPYLILSEIAKFAHQIPVYLQNKNMEIRVLMPRFGVINERRHRLHEVVRLSGINIIIDNDDYPLIIKVASLPGARLQVYFLDNEEFFKRKGVFGDEDSEIAYEDNAERMVFFCKGVMETVKKFGWPPDIIHCHGWMTSLIPMYMKTVYKKEPVFLNSKMVFTAYENQFEGHLNAKIFQQKALISEEIKEKDFAPFKKADNAGLTLGAITHSDGIIQAPGTLPKAVADYIKTCRKPKIETKEDDSYLDDYLAFYQKLMK